MALIECGECRKQISDKAAACPNCGAPQKLSSPAAPIKATARMPVIALAIFIFTCVVVGTTLLFLTAKGSRDSAITDGDDVKRIMELGVHAAEAGKKAAQQDWKEKLAKEGKGPSQKESLEAMQAFGKLYATSNLALERIAKATPQNDSEAALLSRGKEYFTKVTEQSLAMTNAEKEFMEALERIEINGANEKEFLEKIVNAVTKVNDASKRIPKDEVSEQLKPIFLRK
jgi:hypothetical protein